MGHLFDKKHGRVYLKCGRHETSSRKSFSHCFQFWSGTPDCFPHLQNLEPTNHNQVPWVGCGLIWFPGDKFSRGSSKKHLIDRISIRTHGASGNDVAITTNDKLLKMYMLGLSHPPTGYRMMWKLQSSSHHHHHQHHHHNILYVCVIYIYTYLYSWPWKHMLCIVPNVMSKKTYSVLSQVKSIC